MNSPLHEVVPLGFQWPALDPFLFCVHHDDAYPAANEAFGPAASLEGRQIGSDFAGKDGWRMYHGEIVPGFPQHPHRGFETLTLVRRGLIDHSDSLGATARFGHGDAQWLTAGKGIVHSEMFPLLDRGAPNPVELFQIWINLHSEDKMADPHFAMLWSGDIPRVVHDGVTITVVAGELEGHLAPSPPPRSWAARSENEVAVWALAFEPGAEYTLPPARSGEVLRTLYFFGGESVELAGRGFDSHVGVRVDADVSLQVRATGKDRVELLMLQGRPIGEPVAQHGPFVMNTDGELRQAFHDYQSTRFGGWPHASDGPVHGAESERFADRGSGREHPRT